MKHGDRAKSGKIRSRLSFSGWMYVFLCLVIGLAAVNSNNNVLFLITSLLLALLFLSGLSALYNVSGLSLRAGIRGVLNTHEPGPVLVKIKNRKRFSSLVLELSLGVDSVLIPVLGPGEQKEIFLNWVPPRRGRPPLPPIKLTSSFPLGFVRRGGFFDAGPGPVAAPARVEELPHDLFADSREQIHLDRQDRGQGEWTGLRQHRPGEGKAGIVWKRIDWHRPDMGLDSRQWPAHNFAREQSRALVLDWDDPMYSHMDTERRLSVLRTVLDRVVLESIPWELKLGPATYSGQGQTNHESALAGLALKEPLPG